MTQNKAKVSWFFFSKKKELLPFSFHAAKKSLAQPSISP